MIILSISFVIFLCYTTVGRKVSKEERKTKDYFNDKWKEKQEVKKLKETQGRKEGKNDATQWGSILMQY